MSDTKGTLPMPQLILLALIGIIAFWGYRAFVREAERVTARVRRVEKERAAGSHGTLVKDPETGEYRVTRD